MDPLMRSSVVEVCHILIEHPLELPLVKDQDMIKAFLSHTPHEAFADRIGSWNMIGCFENLNRTCCSYTSEAGPKFAIIITNQIRRCLPIGRGFPKLLRHPGIAWRSYHSHMDDLARLQFDEEEGKKRSKEEIGDLEEVAGPDLCGVVARDRSTTSDLVAAVSERVSCTSGWFACTHGCRVSTVLRESVQHPRVDFPSPSA